MMRRDRVPDPKPEPRKPRYLWISETPCETRIMDLIRVADGANRIEFEVGGVTVSTLAHDGWMKVQVIE